MIFGDALFGLTPDIQAAPAPADLPQEFTLPRWIWDGRFEHGIGVASNPLFVDDNEPSAAFMTVGAEFTAIRPALRGPWSFVGYGNVEHRIYFKSADQFPDETLAVIHGRASGRWGWLGTGLTLQASYSDQAFGMAVSPVATETLDLAAFGVLAQPELEVRLPKGVYLRAAVPLERVTFSPSTDNYREPALLGVVGWQGSRTRVEASARVGDRDYDSRPWRSLFGNPRPGTNLRWRTWRTDLVWRQTWDAGRQLRTTSRVRWRGVSDNGVGYDDVEAWEFRQDLALTRGPWTIEGLAIYGEPRYRYQRAVTAVPVERAQEQVYGELKLSRMLVRNWQASGTFSYDQLRSNKAGEDFRNRVFTLRLARLLGAARVDLEPIRD